MHSAKHLHIWLVNIAEPLPFDGPDIRPMRMGLLAEELLAQGHSIHWWTCDFLHFQKRFRPLPSQFREGQGEWKKGLHYTVLKSRGYKKNVSLGRYLNNQELSRQFMAKAGEALKVKKPDVILCSLPIIELAHDAIVLGKKANIPVVVDLRDMWPDIIAERFPTPIRPLLELGLVPLYKKMRFVCQNVKAIFGITPGFVKWGLTYAGREGRQYDRAFHLAYPESLARSAANTESLQYWRSLGVDPNKFVSSYIGSFRPQMDIDSILQSARELGEDYQFVIAGDGPGIEEYKKKSADLKNVFFPGWVNAPQIRALGEVSKVGIAPYRTTKDFKISIPNKPIEYMALGLPILTCLQGELENFLLQHECGLFYPENGASELSQHLRFLKNNPEVQKKFSQNGQRKFLELFTSEKVYAQMRETLEDIAKLSSDRSQ